MTDPATPALLRTAAPTPTRALLAAMALVVASLVMLAFPASARTTGIGCTVHGVAVLAGAGPDERSALTMHPRGERSVLAVTDIGGTDDAATSEFGLPRAVPDAVRSRRTATPAFAPASDAAPATVVPGSPHRPPRSA